MITSDVMNIWNAKVVISIYPVMNNADVYRNVLILAAIVRNIKHIHRVKII
jgi:hypothetical protein